MSSNTMVVLSHIRNSGYPAVLDDDGDIIIPISDYTVVVKVHETFVVAKIAMRTALGVRALAVISRELHDATYGGRMVYPTHAGFIVFDFTQSYQGVPSQFDSVCPVQGVIRVAHHAGQIIAELGYTP